MAVFPAKAEIHNRQKQFRIQMQMFKTIHQYYVCILASNKNGTIYIEMTNDLETRVLQHKQKVNEGFTSKYDVSKLVYFESHQYVNDDIRRETQFKKWNCQWKINLIEEENKDWKDLSEDWSN